MDIPGLGEKNFMPLQNPAKNFMALPQEKKQALLMPKEGKGVAQETDQVAQLRKVAEGFEAVFLFQMMKQMRNTVHQEKLLHGGVGEDVFSEMMDEDMSKKMAKRGAAGIADMLFRQLSREYGIGEENQNSQMPGLSDVAGALQQKLQGAQKQVQSTDPQQMNTDL